MIVVDLIVALQSLPPETQVLIEVPDGTLNTPVLEKHIGDDAAPSGPFVVLALPNPYDTYDGPVSKT